MKLETKGRELDQMVPRENAERLVELLGDSDAEAQVRWQQTGHGLARGRGRGGHERGN